VPVIVECIRGRETNIAMGREIDKITDSEASA
jgi:glyoxylate carboligase